MAAPAYVPLDPVSRTPYYSSPPRRPESWEAVRPGDLDEPGQPSGDGMGHQGPDQGFVLRLARRFQDRLELAEGEHLDDVVAGVTAVALKRASLFGRAPVIHDLTVAATVWGYLDVAPPAELVTLRRELFEGVANPHHYAESRRIPDLVPVEVLRATPAEVVERYSDDWRQLFDAVFPEPSLR